MLLFNLHKWSLSVLIVLVSTSTVQAVREVVVNWNEHPISANLRTVETGEIEPAHLTFWLGNRYFSIVYHDIPGASRRIDFFSVAIRDRILSVRVSGDFGINIAGSRITLLVTPPAAEHFTVLENPFHLHPSMTLVIVNEAIFFTRVIFPLSVIPAVDPVPA